MPAKKKEEEAKAEAPSKATGELIRIIVTLNNGKVDAVEIKNDTDVIALRDAIDAKFKLGGPASDLIVRSPNAAAEPLTNFEAALADVLVFDAGKYRVHVTVPAKKEDGATADLPLAIASALEKLQLATAARKFWVRHWAGTDIKARMLDMPPTYAEFRSLLFLAYSFPVHGKVYYFPNNVLNIAQRVALDNDASFSTFMALPRSNRMLLYLWKHGQDGSPKKEPADEADSQSQMSGVSDFSRGSVQKVWASAVKDVDGWKCVVCEHAIQKHLVGAHIVPVKSKKEELKAAGLPSAYEVRNGVTLCSHCHALFDAGFFYFDNDGKLVVSAALAAHVPEWKARQGTSIHRTTERTRAPNWPEPPMIEWRRQDYDIQQAARHADDHDPFHCKKCDKGYVDKKAYQRHEKSCEKSMPMKTPMKKPETKGD